MQKKIATTPTVNIAAIQAEVTKELSNKQVVNALIATTFKGLSEDNVRKAIVEGMMRSFTFKDFLDKNVYAIPYAQGYSLVTSIDYARKVGMRSGVVGKSAPTFEQYEAEGVPDRIISCTITVKKLVSGIVGEFTETVYFNEYDTKRNQWVTKPHTMIAKVAEMHALRMACPEELSQSYVEEEMQKEVEPSKSISDEDMILYEEKIDAVQTLEELQTVFSNFPFEVKKKLEGRKNELKAKFTEKKDETGKI